MFEIGQVVGGDFRIVRPLSEGGMGKVFVAEQLSTGAQRALKAIHRELVNQPSLRQRFEQEARVVARIPSDHVVQIVAAGVDVPTQAPWLAMELLNGQTLDAAVTERGTFEPEQVVEVMTQLCHGLSAAHGAGIVHRDIKPENVFLAETRRTSGAPFFVKILDFGIARVRAEARTARTAGVGTPLWMAPEQTSTGDNIGPWTDIWPLGLIAFWMFTGVEYWLSTKSSDPTMSVLREILFDPLPAPSVRAAELGRKLDMGPAFDAWFSRCVCREAGERWASADVARAELVRALVSPVASTLAALPTAASRPAPSPHADTALPGTFRLPTPLAPPPTPPAPHGAPSPVGMTPGFPHVSSVPAPGVAARPLRTTLLTVAAIAVVLGAVGIGGAVIASSYLHRSRDHACSSATSQAACQALCAETPGSAPCVTAALLDARSNKSEAVLGAAAALGKLCEGGSGEACVRASLLAAFPPAEGIGPDPKKAMTLARRACQTEPKACGLVGVGVELSWDEDRKDDPGTLYERACGAGEPFGCAYAAAFASKNHPQIDDRVQAPRRAALAALEPACDRGDTTACAAAGALVDTDDVEKAERLDRKACDAGDALGCNGLGAIIAEGRTGPAAPAQALALFVKACDHGEPAGCNNAGAMKSGLLMARRVGPRGGVVYKVRCQRSISIGCAGWGTAVALWPGGNADLTEAARGFEKACAAGLQTSCVTVGALALVGQGVPKNRARARSLFQRACDAGDPGGCAEAASEATREYRDREPDAAKAYALMTKACDGGELDACVVKSSMMARGKGVARNVAAALNVLEPLCESEPFSCSVLGNLYSDGVPGLPKDDVKSRAYNQRSCEKDVAGAGACFELAMAMDRGAGGPKESERAFQLLKTSCDAGNLLCCRFLGFTYSDGRKRPPVIQKDLPGAAKIFENACNLGDTKSCNAFAGALIYGDGVPMDASRGSTIAREACDDGYPPACGTYGLLLDQGVGVTKDEAAAKEYLVGACQYKVELACKRLEKKGIPLPAPMNP